MVAPELKLTKKVSSNKKQLDFHCQGLQLTEFQRLSQEDSTCCRQTSRLTDTLEVARAVQRLHGMEERRNHTATNVESESERSLREL